MPDVPIQVIEPRTSISAWTRDLWSFRGVLWALCVRDVRGKYKQAVLGVAWAVIQPAVQVAIFTFVFRGVAAVNTPLPYPVFALAALIPFNLFQQSVGFGAPGFVAAQGIVTKVYFPRIYTVVAAGAAAFVNCAVSLALLVTAAVLWRIAPGPAAVLAAIPLLGVSLLSVGSAALLASLNARFRDVQHALPLLMSGLLYLSPVLYPVTAVPELVRPIALANPLTGLVDGFRALALGLAPYSWTLLGVSLVSSALVFAVGVWVFERTQSRLIDVL
jgi:lipopolysaccharide transport system permease protein